MMPTDSPGATLWRDGWYRCARHLASPNFGPRPIPLAIDLIVVHAISLPPGQYGGDAVHQLFTNQLDGTAHPYFRDIAAIRVSAHFFVQRSGNLWQFVSTWQRAWHAGQSNHLGRANCNDFSIGIELEGVAGEPFEAEQYESLVSLCAAIGQQHPIRHVAGHEHIAPARKSDPGSGFLWSALECALGWPAPWFAAARTGLPPNA